MWGVASQRAIGRRQTTLEHLRRSEDDTNLNAARKRFIALAKAPGGLAAWADEDKENSEETQTIRLVLNTYELVAIGIQRGIIDYELYKRWYRSGTIKHWQHAAPFVAALRGRLQNDAIYREFEVLVHWLNGTKPPRRSIWMGQWF
jgi:hypothetical protein